jgi:hypothetical protein
MRLFACLPRQVLGDSHENITFIRPCTELGDSHEISTFIYPDSVFVGPAKR